MSDCVSVLHSEHVEIEAYENLMKFVIASCIVHASHAEQDYSGVIAVLWIWNIQQQLQKTCMISPIMKEVGWSLPGSEHADRRARTGMKVD